MDVENGILKSSKMVVNVLVSTVQGYYLILIISPYKYLVGGIYLLLFQYGYLWNTRYFSISKSTMYVENVVLRTVKWL